MYAFTVPLIAAGTLVGQEFEAPQQTEYKGPAVLSRGRSSSFRAPFQSIKLRPFANLSSTYATNLQTAADSAQGLNYTEQGLTASGGVYGIQRWRRKELSIGYTGGYTRYRTNKAFNGPEQFLTAQFGWQLSPRFMVQFQETGGTTTRATMYAYQSGLYSSSLRNFIPRDEAFDNRVYFANSSAMLVFRKSARLSYSIGGDHFIQHRVTQLPSVAGFRTRADVNYRLSRDISIGGDYEYTDYRFTRGAGNSQFHAVGFDYSQRFGRNWELVSLAGFYQIQNVSIIDVPVDPEVALIVGRTSVAEVRNMQVYSPRVQVSLTRMYRKGIIGGQFISDVNPGNGQLLTARGISAQAVARYAPSTKVGYHTVMGWERKTGVQRNQINAIEGYFGSGAISYNFAPNLHFTTSFMLNNRSFDAIKRNYLQVAAGVSYSPGEMPLTMW